MIKEACNRLVQQELAHSAEAGRGASAGLPPHLKAVAPAGKRSLRSPRSVHASAASYTLSERLTALRAELVASGAYVDWQDLEEMCIVGKGTFSIVTKCKYEPQQSGGRQRVVAVKQIRTELLNNPREVATFLEEVKLLRKLNYKYIVRFYGCGWTRVTEEEESTHGGRPPTHHQLFFTQEYMEGGTLQELVVRAMTNQEGQVYGEVDALRWSLQIALALEYLHTREPKVIHRDLKLENILLSRRDPAKACAKLADFGLARRLQGASARSKEHSARLERMASTSLEDLAPLEQAATEGLEARLEAWMAQPTPDLAERSYQAMDMTSRAGSLGYMAPEVLRGLPYNQRADVFSFGIIMYNLFHRNIPSLHIMLNGSMKDLEAYAHKVAHGFRQKIEPQRVPPGVASLIERCWQQDPKRRPSMSQVARDLQAMQPPLPEDDGAEVGPPATVQCTCVVM
ncbi:hypothetical protein N2152v2_007930 [Parachlorella kessleri]